MNRRLLFDAAKIIGKVYAEREGQGRQFAPGPQGPGGLIK